VSAVLTLVPAEGNPAHLVNSAAVDDQPAYCKAQNDVAAGAIHRAARIDTTVQLDSLGVLEEVLRHFYLKAGILESLGEQGDFDAVDRAWSEVGRWAREVAQYRHAKIQAVRLAMIRTRSFCPKICRLSNCANRPSLT
jgi:hypothetical protein